MFSHRLPEDLDPNAFSKLLARKRAEGARLLDLTESNPTRAGIPYPSEAILSALSDARSLVYEPTPRGLLAAREAVAAYYADHGQRVHPDQVLLTASTSEAYAYLFKLLADPGESFLVPTPSYPLFDLLAGLEDVALVAYPLAYERGWRVDWDSFRRLLGRGTRGVLVVNPNNPTGSCLREADVAELARRTAGRDVAVVCDEVFSDYVSADGVVKSIAGREDLASFSLSGLSKVCGLPQLKLGWIVINGAPPFRAEAMRRLELIADTYLSVGAPVQHATARLVAMRGGIQEAIRGRVKANGERLERFCREAWGSSERVLASDGGWYAVLDLPAGRTDEAAALGLLEDDDVLVHPGYFFGLDEREAVVASLLTPTEAFEEALGRIGKRWTGEGC